MLMLLSCVWTVLTWRKRRTILCYCLGAQNLHCCLKSIRALEPSRISLPLLQLKTVLILDSFVNVSFQARIEKLDPRVDTRARDKHQTNIGSFFSLFLGAFLYRSGQLKSLRDEIT